MNEGAGKHAGARRAAPSTESSRGTVALLGAGVGLCVLAWGWLVFAAIDFGRTARAGSGSSWFLLLVAALGAVACLFTGLLLGMRVLRTLGMTGAQPRVAGGRRAKR